MQNKYEVYFPGFTKKSVSFTIDDGNIEMDRKFLSIVRPHGIIGTFNLCEPIKLTAEQYREMYKGYGIANHVKLHPEVFKDTNKYVALDGPYDPLTSERYTEDTPFMYKTDTEDVYFINDCKTDRRPGGWSRIVDHDTYLRLAEECLIKLREIFGDCEVKEFVWPYGEQSSARLVEAIKSAGYLSVRKTGEIRDTTSFSLPADRMAWSYNATNRSLLEVMKLYEAQEDDGELKFFCFGVHSYDFERDKNWSDLEAFAQKYGNRPSDYYYASVREILEYEDAVRALTVYDGVIRNKSARDVYISLGERRFVLKSESEINTDL